ncbi:MAG: iron-sulfur cluster assembly accessory protein [Alphaproteobacteria bacterium]|nr:iron-sulfur cluster assembly accessory protein [Alphaproteobacteria bacterium]
MTDIAGPQEKPVQAAPGAPPQAVTLTAGAAQRVRALIAQDIDANPGRAEMETPVALWVGVKTKGCSGLSYDMRFVSRAEAESFAAMKRFERPEKVEAGGVTVYVDGKASLYLVGTTMDWVDDGLGAKFAFINPNEKGRCGCGESFHV